MVGTKNRRVCGDIQGLLERGAIGHLTDAQLLDLFCRQRDAEVAFETLILRHGPSVLRTCRKVLGDHHDADDAFQATFLVLARRASSVHPAQSVGPWLYGVARRISLKARTAAIRRRMHERQSAVSVLFDPAKRFELSEELHEEIAPPARAFESPRRALLPGANELPSSRSSTRCVRGNHPRPPGEGPQSFEAAALTRRRRANHELRHPASNDQKPIVPLVLLDAATRAAIAFAVPKADQPKMAASILRLANGALRMMFVSRIVGVAIAVGLFGIAATAFVALESACSRAVLANAAQGRPDPSLSKSASGVTAAKIIAQADPKKVAMYDIAIEGKAIAIEPKTDEIRVDGPGKLLIWVDRGFLNESDEEPSNETKQSKAKSRDAASTSPAKAATSINPPDGAGCLAEVVDDPLDRQHAVHQQDNRPRPPAIEPGRIPRPCYR